MKNQLHLMLFALLFSAPLSLFAQEICNNGVDDDGDGFVDCYDNECSGTAACADSYIGGRLVGDSATVADFDMKELWNSSETGAPTIYGSNHTVVGDVDGDGVPEVFAVRRNKSGSTLYNGDDALYMFNGDDGTLKDSLRLGGATTLYMALADVEGDGCAEIFIGRRDDAIGQFRLLAINCDLTIKWESDPIPGTGTRQESVGILGVADFDEDGSPEVYVKGKVLDALTGDLKVNIAHYEHTHNHLNAGTVAVDILSDGECGICDGLELVIGEDVYAVDVQMGVFSLERTLHNYNASNDFISGSSSDANNIHFTSIADMDQDGDLDAIITGHDNSTNEALIYYWDIQNESESIRRVVPPPVGGSNRWGPGRVAIADLNGDNQPELVFNNDDVFAFSFDWAQDSIQLLWQTDFSDGSALTGVATYDFDANGTSEIVYRSPNFLYMIDGATGNVYNRVTTICASGTYVENPIIADINGDGATEICIPCQPNNSFSTDNEGWLQLYGAATGQRWAPSRSVWNQHGYFNVNINDDLTVPIELQDHSLAFNNTLCDGSPGLLRPLNTFLSQSTLLDGDGCPQSARPDLAFVPGSFTQREFAHCITDSVGIQFQVINQGKVALDETVSVSYYAGNPEDSTTTWLGTDSFALTLNSGEQTTLHAYLDSLTNFTLFAVLNDDGTATPPIGYPVTKTVSESNYSNNTDSLVLSEAFALEASVTSFNYVCDSTLMNNAGEVQAFARLGNEPVTAGLTFYWFEGTTAAGTVDYTGATVSGLAEGNYTVYAQSNATGCSSDTVTVTVEKRTIDSTLTARIDEVALNTACVGANGELMAIVKPTDATDSVGDDPAGYTFRWELGTSIGSNSPISFAQSASGIEGGVPYSVRVTDTLTGCTVDRIIPVTGEIIVYPVAQLDSVAPNQQCVGGNGYAAASVGGDTTNYTFAWYDGALDFTVEAMGAVRPQLPGGEYFVIATDNNTGCSDTLPIRVEDMLTLPEINVLSRIDQTSCLVDAPNGEISVNSWQPNERIYQSPDSVDFFSTVGSASAVSAARYQLTPNENSIAGAIWMNQQVLLTEDFVVNALLNFGDRDGNGADGIAFVLHKHQNGLLSRGDDAQEMGAGGLDPGIAIEFDTFSNSSGFGDITEDHVAVSSTQTRISFGTPLEGPYPMDELGSNFEDGQDHEVQISWDASASLITVFIDGEQRIHFTYDVVNQIFSGDPWAYLGFTASTGGARNDQQVEIKGITATTGVRNPNVSLEWFDGPNTVTPLSPSNLQGDSIASGLPAGLYRVRATDAVSGCTITEDITLEDDLTIPSLNQRRVSFTSNTACDSSLANGGLEVWNNAVSPSPNQENNIVYIYSWWMGNSAVGNPDFTGPILSGVPAGDYTLVVTDDQTYCSTTESVFTLSDDTQSDSITIDLDFCEAYVFGGESLTSSGTYVKAFPNVLGCDSVVTLNLTLYPRGDTSVLDCTPSSWVLDLPLDACSGTTATNTVGVDATTVGPAWREGYTGQGLYFDGRDDYVNLGVDSGLVFTNAFSVAMWVKSTEDGPVVLMTRNREGNSFSWNVRLDGGVLQAILGGLPNPGPYVGTTDVTDGTWHHVAVTYTTGLVNLYVDGVLDATHSVPLGMLGANTSSEVWIGMRADKPNERQFKGYLDDIQT
ncbi:MAG TPA: hypothetical protein DCP28_12770, partial [Cytophagales bacterium]|nr:hypothetical protein [Cytophagales bacterium]